MIKLQIHLLTPLLALIVAALPTMAQTPSPYAGEQGREVKALSEQEIDDLLSGAGMGLAMAAELNHHPGPKHVLELAGELGLTAEQREAVQASFDAMHRRAVELGRRIVDAETALDRAFAAGGPSAAELDERVMEIARLRGALRATHLRAHLETRAALAAEQVTRYDELRGYGDGGDGAHRHTRHQGH